MTGDLMTTIGAQETHTRVAVVTGGGGGIGTAAALHLAREGAFVVVVDPGVGVQGEPLHEPSAEHTAKLVQQEGGRAEASTVSVTDFEALTSLFRKVVDEHGSLDAVVNTAGFLRYPKLSEASEEDWMAVLDVHFNGYRNVLRAALPHMIAAGYG
jgi:NAD(P)-dependent dehydrogenase (short-subunit alcohol dehydrogenase family)